MKNQKFVFRKMIVIVMTAVLLTGGSGSYLALPVQAKEPDVESIASESNAGEEDSAEIIADTDNAEIEDDAGKDTDTTDASEEGTAGNTVKTGLPADEELSEEEESEKESAEEEIAFVLDGISELPDNDELLMGYLDQMFYEDRNADVSLYGNVGAQRLTDANEKKMYNELKTAIEQIAAGSRTSTQITVSGLSLSSSTGGDSARKVISYLMMDCPYDFYWYDKTADSVLNVYLVMGIINKIDFPFMVAEEYRGSNDFTVNTSKTSLTTKAVSNAKTIISKHAAESDHDKLYSYCNEICQLVDYNYDAADTNMAYGNPWQLIWVFDDDPNTKVVCEGYAKAFQYLCDLSAFKDTTTACYTVTGTMGDGRSSGGHMWNIVTLGGQNYLADVTNSDAGTTSNNYLFGVTPKSGTVDNGYTFLVGSQAILYNYYKDQISLFGKKILRLNPSEPEYEDSLGSGSNTGANTGTATQPAVPVSKSVTLSLNGQSLKNNTTLKVTYSKKYTFKATVLDTTGKTLTSGNGKITWSTSNKKIATVTSSGKVTVKKKAGTVTITAKTADGKTAKVKLKAAKAAVKVTKVKITGSKTMSLKTKKTQTLKATVSPASAANQKVTWKSSNKKIATVNSKGKVTAKKAGTVTITATAKDGSKKKATIKIKIKK